MIRFEVPGNPQGLKRHRLIRGTQFAYDPSKGDKADFLALAMQHRPEKPLTGPLSVLIVAYFPRPKAHYGTGSKSNVLKADAPQWCNRAPDADNIGKFVGDSLNGIFWQDDRVIAQMICRKRYSDRPRVEIAIEELTE